jgi:predicted S18 family serine protease
MLKIKAKHTKIRNTGLLYEFLLRQITSDILNNKDSKAVGIIKNRFNERTELGKELALYNIVLNRKYDTDRKADYFLHEVINSRKSLNNTQLKREKYNLIKEIKDIYDLGKFLSSTVNDYKVYSSIYRIFEYKSELSPELKTESHFNLVEHLTTKNDNIKLSETVTHLPADEDLRILTYKMLLEKFNSKYSKLNSPQKKLLKEYINNVSNTSSLKDTLQELVVALKIDLKKHSKNLKDKVVKIKLKEAIKSINDLCGTKNKSQVVKDSYVIQTMRYLELLKELKKSARNKTKTIHS